MKKNEYEIKWTKGKGPGGQNRNKLETACKVTHVATGTVAWGDCRTRSESRKQALRSLEEKLDRAKEQADKDKKKADRDHKIHNTPIVRTYHYGRGTVKDHRSGKIASIKDVVEKGKVDLLRPDDE